jgi:hypothetical protein
MERLRFRIKVGNRCIEVLLLLIFSPQLYVLFGFVLCSHELLSTCNRNSIPTQVYSSFPQQNSIWTILAFRRVLQFPAPNPQDRLGINEAERYISFFSLVALDFLSFIRFR